MSCSVKARLPGTRSGANLRGLLRV